MCRLCAISSGYCFCGTRFRPNPAGAKCDCLTGGSPCQYCGHQARADPGTPASTGDDDDGSPLDGSTPDSSGGGSDDGSGNG
jgi:hypothetical protein